MSSSACIEVNSDSDKNKIVEGMRNSRSYSKFQISNTLDGQEEK